MRLAETVDGKQFLNAVANISIWKETPKYHPCDSKLFCAKYEERLKTFALNEVLGRPSKEFRKEKKNKIRKMKLHNQRKLGAITNSISDKSARNEAEAPVNGRNDSSETKTAKDFEHYRKSKRPTRI